ncbi:unnamed protein product [Ectocarpus fasciculatus]
MRICEWSSTGRGPCFCRYGLRNSSDPTNLQQIELYPQPSVDVDCRLLPPLPASLPLLLLSFSRRPLLSRFNPAVYPVSAADHEELAAAENFNREMAELEALEHQEELRSLLQARISALQQGTSGNQRPAKIASLSSAMFSGLSRGAPASGLKGKRFNPAKKCPHNINQPLQTGRNN